MRKFILLALISTSIFANAQKTILVKCGKLLDTKSGTVLEKQYVLIKGNTVVSVGSNEVSADSTIDLSGYFVMPGLIDCHTHVLLQGAKGIHSIQNNQRDQSCREIFDEWFYHHT